MTTTTATTADGEQSDFGARRRSFAANDAQLALLIADTPSEAALAAMSADELRSALLVERESLIHAAVEAEYHRRAIQRDNELLCHQ